MSNQVSKSVLLAPSKIPDLSTLQYPLLASYKLDGNRNLLKQGTHLTRSMKVQPNANLVKHLKEITKDCRNMIYDGELWSPKISFSDLQSILRSHDAPIPSHVQFYVFDCLTVNEWESGDSDPYDVRIKRLKKYPNVVVLSQTVVQKQQQIQDMYDKALRSGTEGLILRNPKSPYKWGRATLNEGIIFKLKPFDPLDAKIIGYEQQRSLNQDVDTGVNEIGRKKRTHKAEHYGLADTLGSLVVQDEQGRVFNCGWGEGWTHEKRKNLWDRRDELIGQWVIIRSMGVGEKNLPRMPQLISFRDSK